MKYTKLYPWIVVALLWGVALLNYMDRQMLSTMRDAMMVDIVELESATNFGRLMAVFLWVYGLISPFAGAFADRINRKGLIVGSLFVWSGVTFLMSYSTSFSQLYFLRAIMGISEAFYIPAALSLIADYHQDKTRSLAVGIHMTGFYIGQALGGFGATLAETHSWESTFYIFGLIGIAYSIVLVIFLKDIDNREVETKVAVKKCESFGGLFKGLSALLGNMAFWVILFYFAVPSLPGWAAKNWLPTLLASSLSISMEQAGPIATFTIAAASFIGVIAGGILSDKWVQNNVKGRVYTGAIGLGLMIPALFLLGFGNNLFFFLGGAVSLGLGWGMFDANNMPILCQFVSSRYRATSYGIMNMTGVFAGAYITGLLGKSMDAGNLGRDFALLAILLLVVLVIQLQFLHPQTSDRTKDKKSEV